MPDNTEAIGSGETYTTLQGWENGVDGDLVSSTTRQIGEAADENFDEQLSINGSTTDTSFYMWLRAASGAEFDHTAETGARQVTTGASTAIVNVYSQDDFTRIGGSEGASSGAMGVKGQTTEATTGSFGYRDGNQGIQLSQLTVFQSHTAAGITAFGGTNLATQKCQNCLAYDISTTDTGGTRDAQGFRNWNSTSDGCVNCVAYNINADINDGDDAFGFFACECRNCYGGAIEAGADNETAYWTNCTGDYNGADDATTSLFTNETPSVAGASQFVSVTGGSEDFHLTSGADLIDAGNDDQSNEFDIDGSFTGTRDDLGIHEFVAAAGSQPYNPWLQRGAILAQ